MTSRTEGADPEGFQSQPRVRVEHVGAGGVILEDHRNLTLEKVLDCLENHYERHAWWDEHGAGNVRLNGDCDLDLTATDIATVIRQSRGEKFRLGKEW